MGIFLYNTVNYLYHSVADHLPQSFQNHPEMLAFGFGAAGIFGVVSGLQWASKHIMDKVIPDKMKKLKPFDEKCLPALESICIGAIMALPIYMMVDVENLAHHPVYMSGMAGVFIGSLAGAYRDLYARKANKTKSIDEIVK